MRTRCISNNLHLESTVCLYGPSVNHTGFIEGFILTLVTNSAVFGAGRRAAVSAVTTVLTTLTVVGIGIGLNYLAPSLLAQPQQPKPQDVQASTRQPLQPRFRYYGRVKPSGAWAFAEAKDGNFPKVLAIASHRIDAIEEY